MLLLQCRVNWSSVTFSTILDMKCRLLTGLQLVLIVPSDFFFTIGLTSASFYGVLNFPWSSDLLTTWVSDSRMLTSTSLSLAVGMMSSVQVFAGILVIVLCSSLVDIGVNFISSTSHWVCRVVYF